MTIWIYLAGAMGRAPTAQRYRLCGVEVCADLPLQSLSAFALDDEPGMGALAREAATDPAPSVRFRTDGVLAGRMRSLDINHGGGITTIDIEGIGTYGINHDTSKITLETLNESVDPESVEESLLGVPLLTSLAMRDCWMLHASSVMSDGMVIACAGTSGAGKSTLAEHLDATTPWTRTGDDLLGLGVVGDDVHAYPAYPQLKLPETLQPAVSRSRLGAVVFLRPLPDSGELDIRPMERSEKIIQLARHGVATRAFPPDLLGKHFRFCHAAAGVDMFEIRYPHDEAALERLVRWIGSGAAVRTADESRS